MQPDRRLVEHVEHAGQLRSDLRGEPNALTFAARQRRRAAAEREIADANIQQKTQAIADFADDAAGNRGFALGQRQRLDERERIGQRHLDELRQPMALHANGAALGTKTRAPARCARLQRAIRLEHFLVRPRALFEAAPQVGNHAFEVGAERILGLGDARGVGPAAWRAMQHNVALLLRQLAERRLRVDAERVLEPAEHLVDRRPVAAAHGSDRASGQRDSVSSGMIRAEVEVVNRAEPLTRLTGAMRRVERKRARAHLRNADAARRTRHPPREQPVAAVQRVDDDDVFGSAQRQVD